MQLNLGTKIKCSVVKYNNPSNLDKVVTYNSKIHIRGATSKRFDKKSYKLNVYTEDYETGEITPIGYEPSNVLYFELSGGGFFVIRPSGTEPKIKVYYSVCENSKEKAKERHAKLKAIVDGLIG